MTIEEELINTYEKCGFLVQNVTRLPEGTFDVDFLTTHGVTVRRVSCAFVVIHDYQKCESNKVIPNN